MDIIQYMIQQAENTTDRPLPKLTNREDLEHWTRPKRRKFAEMTGVQPYLDQARSPLNVTVTGTLQRDGYRIEKLHLQSLPDLFVAGNLYIPDGLADPAPAVLYLCGHSHKQKVNYQEHGRRFAQLGFVTLILDTIELGEVQGIHRGTHRLDWFHWISKGYTPLSIEVWNAIRGIDLLCAREDVDSDRIGITGHSGGGCMSWWTACIDDRIKALAPSCGTGTVASHIREHTIDTHCDCVFPSNPFGWSLLESCALVAPRPVLIATPDQDKHFSIESVREVYSRLRSFYGSWGDEELVSYVEFNGPHGYAPESRKAIFSFFMKYLQGVDVSADDIADLDGVKEAEQDLLVFQGYSPANDRSTSVQDWFIPSAAITLPETIGIGAFRQMKSEIMQKLHDESFHKLTTNLVDPDLQYHQQWLGKDGQQSRKFSYATENSDWRIYGESLDPIAQTDSSPLRPAAIYLREEDDTDGTIGMSKLDIIPQEWLKFRLDPRGTGHTSWSPEMTFHIRRSLALMGKTVCSLRVQDTLQGIAAIRSTKNVNPHRIMLVGRGEMAVVAIMAALLDGSISEVVVQDPPASCNRSDGDNGRNSKIELFHMLRHCDIAQAAGLLWPIKLIFLGARPQEYVWTEELYRTLGQPGGIWRVDSIQGLPQSFWSPEN